MRIEVLCTGDELLTGLAADTNSPFFMERVLLELGQQVGRATVVGDDREELVGALRELCARSDAVLVSGGLGPTSDDLTVECAAAAAGVPLAEDPQALGWIRERFERLKLPMTPNNARQARVPQGAEAVRNPVGTAPMIVQRIGGCDVFYVPGVPREYRHLVEHEVLPRLSARVGKEPGRVYRSLRVLKTIGLPESKLDALVEPLRAAHPEVTFGFRTRAPENHLKLLARGRSPAEAKAALDAAAAACRPVLARWLFGEDEQTFAGAIGELLKSRGRTVAVAESCTGGLCAEQLTAVPGASGWFVGSAVVYQEAMKQRWAGVQAKSLAEHGAVSPEVATELASGVRVQAGASYGVGITGYAGPTGGTPEDPVGTFYCAVASAEGAQVQRGRVDGDRERVRQFAAYRALEMLWRDVQGAA